jgi:hypothetical protein
LKLILAFVLLPAHAPVCKVAAVEACTHAPFIPNQPSCSKPPCCKKCEHDPAEKKPPLAPKPDHPLKPVCPTDCLSPLCTVFSAVVSDSFDSAQLDQPTAERIPNALQLLSSDGFHTLLDRPPRA